MPTFQISGAASHEEDVAAAIAAVTCLLAEESQIAPDQPALASGWQSATRLISQGLRPARTAAPSRWGNIERLRRSGGGGGGIVGS